MLAGHSLSLSPRKTEPRSCVNREVAWTLIPYPVLLPSLKSPTVSVDVKHHETRRRNHQSYNNCVNSEVGLDSHYLSRSSPVPKKSPTVSADVMHHQMKEEHRGNTRKAATGTTETEILPGTLCNESNSRAIYRNCRRHHDLRYPFFPPVYANISPRDD